MVKIVDVWENNLKETFLKINNEIDKYSYVAIDTEFPGSIVKLNRNFSKQSEYIYQQLRYNVELLDIIQIGITLYENQYSKITYQFNFKYDLENKMYKKDSIDLLKESKIDFNRLKEQGIKKNDFALELMFSRLIKNKQLTWVSYHSATDFAYIYKLLCNRTIPEDKINFKEFLNIYFGNFYDIKYILQESRYAKKGLQEISNDLNVRRVGVQHQAGSDSLLTCELYFKVYSEFKSVDFDVCKNKFYGIHE